MKEPMDLMNVFNDVARPLNAWTAGTFAERL